MATRSAARDAAYVAVPALAVWIAVTLVALSSVSPLESPPCPPFSYSVSYASPFCNVTFLAHTGPIRLENLWWAAPWNATANTTTGAGFERASDHVDVTPSAEHPIAVQDRDGDRNLTEGDILATWSPGGYGGNLVLLMGASATSLSGESTLQLRAGYGWTCGAGAPNYAAAVGLGAVAAAVTGLSVALALHLRRREPRS